MKIERVSNEAVELRIGGEAVSLDAEGLDRLLRQVAYIRADMRPEVPGGLEKTTSIGKWFHRGGRFLRYTRAHLEWR